MITKWPTSAAWMPILQSIGGEKMAKITPKLFNQESFENKDINFHAKYPCRVMQAKYQMPKYWKGSVSIGDSSLKKSANSGIESENTIELPISRPYFRFSPTGKDQSSCLKKTQPR